MWCSESLPTSSLCDAVQRVSVPQAEHGQRHFTTRRTGLSVNEGSHPTLLDKKKLESQLGQALVPEVVDIPRDASSDASGEANIHLPGYLDKVEELLNVVHAKTLAHVSSCQSCTQWRAPAGAELSAILRSKA